MDVSIAVLVLGLLGLAVVVAVIRLGVAFGLRTARMGRWEQQ
jgi:uncharacterized membrane protein